MDQAGLRLAVTNFIEHATPPGAVTQVAALAVAGELTPDRFVELIGDPDNQPPELASGLLDLVLHYVTAALTDHVLTVEELDTIQFLKTALHVQPGAFALHRPREVQSLLAIEIRRILEDREVDSSEALYNGQLQQVFDLDSREFTDLTRSELDRILRTIIAEMSAERTRPVSAEDLSWYERELRALGVVYRIDPKDLPQATES